jgi:hypothetical protein
VPESVIDAKKQAMIENLSTDMNRCLPYKRGVISSFLGWHSISKIAVIPNEDETKFVRAWLSRKYANSP